MWLALVLLLVLGAVSLVHSLSRDEEESVLVRVEPDIMAFPEDLDEFMALVPEEEEKGFFSDEEVDGFIKYVKRFLSIPYVSGGKNPDSGFDCSGFVSYIFRHYGVKLAGSALDIWDSSLVSDIGEPMIGDIVFFNHTVNSKGDEISHVGIYIGDGTMIHAGMDGIQIASLDLNYWTDKLVGFNRAEKDLAA